MTLINSAIRATLRTTSVGVALLRSLITLTLITLFLLNQPVLAATPVGTVIENTAKITYSTINFSNAEISSNTDQLTVDGYGVTDTASITTTSTPNTTEFYPGDTFSYDMTLINRGDNDLTSGLLTFTIPIGATLSLDTGTLMVIPSAIPSGYTTVTYSIADLLYGESLLATATITLPNAIATGSQSIDITYNANGTDITTLQNPLIINSRTGATLELLHYSPIGTETIQVSPTKYNNGTSFVNLAAPMIPNTSTPVTDQPLPLTASKEFSHGQTLFVKVNDNDNNHDPLVADVVEIDLAIADNGESEKIQLTENGPDTGIFTGYIALANSSSVNTNDGSLSVQINTELTANYIDSVDASDTSFSIILVDPYGKLFDSKNGTYLDGFTVHLMDKTTGLHATVFGDDGVSIYDNPVVSGGVATDTSGAVYNFETGSYRFPFVAPGDYQLVVEPPVGSNYRWPTLLTDAELDAVPGGPFVVDLGSRGETFQIIPGPPLHLDIPIDLLTTQIYVRRTASKEQVAAGDFMQFNVHVENMTLANITNSVLTDTLPKGFRFKEGTAKLDGVAIADPAISDDGRTLTFDLSTINVGNNYQINYIVEVGAVRAGIVTSTSYAIGNAGGADSNSHSLNTNIKEDFMLSSNILAGQVVVHDEQGKPTDKGLENIRIYMEDGRYVVTDEKGNFHFENIKPGTHVVQLDIDTLPSEYEILPFEQNTRFAGRAWSKFIDLQGGTLWRVNFYTTLKPKTLGNLKLNLSSEQEKDNGIRKFHFTINNKTVPLSNSRLVAILPEGMNYRPGSSKLNSFDINDPDVRDNIITFNLPDINGDWDGEVTFDTNTDTKNTGEFVTKAMLVFDTPDAERQRSPLIEHRLTRVAKELNRETFKYTLTENFATLSTELSRDGKMKLNQLAEQLRELNNIILTVKGYSDNLQIKENHSSEYTDNLTLSGYRALAVANYLREKLRLTPEQINVVGEGEDDPVADNSTPEGRAQNRRVELYISAQKVDTVSLFSAPVIESSPIEVETVGNRGEQQTIKAATAPIEKETTKVTYNERWLASAQPGIEWLSPAEGELPSLPSVTLAIKHDKEQTIEAILNGQPVSPRNYDGTAKNRNGIALSRWSGVDLIEGDNHFAITVRDIDGNAVSRLERVIHYSSDPVFAELIKDQSILTADGINQAMIAIRLTDKDGYPARKGLRGEYHINQPYEAARTTLFDPSILPGSAEQVLMYTVENNGMIRIPLAPTSTSGTATIRLSLLEGEKSVSTYLNAPARDWIIVGFAEGTVGYNTLSGKTEDLEDPAGKDNIYSDGKIAFFAKGQVLGEWLLTMAYDSEKQTLSEDRRLFQTIDPTAYYTVYGDASVQGYDAASREKLYLKLERDEFYALFGDYNTDINGTKLSKYNRALTGLKSEYHNDGLDVVLFSSETNQAFIHDEIRGKGVTGPYQLSRSNILLNSELVTIEVRDRFQSQNIISSRQLQRHLDYTINYETGTLTFREPISQNDPTLNHNYIVVKYESYDESDESYNYGARVRKQVTDNTRVGITHINEGSVGGENMLTGADIEHNITSNTLVRAEVVGTSNADNSQDVSSSAYLAELEHRGNNWDAKAYVAETGENFGIGQTNGSENGTRKMGVEATLRHNNVTLSGESYQNENLQTDAVRNVTEADAQLRAGNNNFRIGLRNARDEMANGTAQETNQLTIGASRLMLDNKLTLRVDREQALGKAENIDFPTVTRFGADYKLTDMTSLFAEHEITAGEDRETQYTQAGIKSTPWSGADLFTGIKHTQDVSSESTSASAALNQLWEITDLWSMNFGVERSETLSSKQTTPFDPEVPYAHGNDDGNNFGAVSVGVTYNPGDWIWNARTEYRDSSSEDSWAFDTSAQTNPTREISLLSALQLFDSKAVSGQHTRNNSLRFDIAYRPLKSKWMVLDKLELINEINSGGDFSYENSRVVNNLNANYFAIRKWQLGLQYGVKYVKETIDQVAYDGVTNLYGTEARYDLSKTWDIGAQASALHNVNNSQYDYSAGLSLGHSFVENVWLSIGYNAIGFYDRDFSKGRSTSQGIYLKFRIKFDQQSIHKLKEKLKK